MRKNNAYSSRAKIVRIGDVHRLARAFSVELLEADARRVLSEAATAQIERILADEAMAVGANAARARASAVLFRMAMPDIFVAHDCGLSSRDARRFA